MNSIFFLVFRRMRAPLLALVLVYAITILGFVLIPGIDENGAPWRMSFFHAFYFVSYMATTIGFGEIPRAFSEMQRLWTLVSIYSTVVVWLYSFGTIIALIQDRALQQAFAKTRFARRVRHQVDVFYLICGYGETGSSLVQALAERNQHSVVIDVRPDRISLLELQDYPMFIPGICADARVPQHLSARPSNRFVARWSPTPALTLWSLPPPRSPSPSRRQRPHRRRRSTKQ